MQLWWEDSFENLCSIFIGIISLCLSNGLLTFLEDCQVILEVKISILIIPTRLRAHNIRKAKIKFRTSEGIVHLELHNQGKSISGNVYTSIDIIGRAPEKLSEFQPSLINRKSPLNFQDNACPHDHPGKIADYWLGNPTSAGISVQICRNLITICCVHWITIWKEKRSRTATLSKQR